MARHIQMAENTNQITNKTTVIPRTDFLSVLASYNNKIIYSCCDAFQGQMALVQPAAQDNIANLSLAVVLRHAHYMSQSQVLGYSRR